jgi:WD40 repeat protein
MNRWCAGNINTEIAARKNFAETYVRAHGSAVLWDVRAERPLAEFVGGRRSRGIYSMVLTPDGKTLLAGCGDGTIKRWEMPSDRQWK